MPCQIVANVVEAHVTLLIMCIYLVIHVQINVDIYVYHCSRANNWHCERQRTPITYIHATHDYIIEPFVIYLHRIYSSSICLINSETIQQR